MSRFSKQKKMWYEKLTYTINRRIFNLKELERMETEKAVKSVQIEPFIPRR